uniref:Uncharacterized protein n=1 Tax=Myoviridae sp. ctool15 TaxID=2826696 RepID=A0A8S5QXK0_9CAUD|nr:MAG TPA: hypothetical protein [Myoviridae sp. ctool15]
MNIYHETTLERLENPDLTLGRTYPARRFVAHHDAVAEVSHLEVMPGTEAMNGGKGLRGMVIDVPAKDAWDEYEDCLYYHPYTEEELAAMHPPDPQPTPVPDTAATWDELAAAYTEGVNT